MRDRFDPLGYQPPPEGRREADYALEYGKILGIVQHIPHEALTDQKATDYP